VFAGGGTTDNVLQHLETSRAELKIARAKGDDIRAVAVEAEWRAWLHHLLRSDPAMGEELRRLFRRHEPGPAGQVYNVNSGDVHFGSMVQAGQISGSAFNTKP
jgi:NADH:ubiquinone oxidoreductase subunit